MVVSRQWASRLSPRNSPTFVSVLLMLMARSMGGVSIDGETRGRQAALSLHETRGPTKDRAALINLRDSSPLPLDSRHTLARCRAVGPRQGHVEADRHAESVCSVVARSGSNRSRAVHFSARRAYHARPSGRACAELGLTVPHEPGASRQPYECRGGRCRYASST